jgi:peptidoglycan/LPS O-acetylase OafA/YrhL
VDLFFVLSGFLVSGLLFAEYRSKGRLSVGRFYVRRGWKIYPAFFFLIGVTLVVRAACRVATPGWEIVSEVLFLQSYVGGMWNHTWSLAVEEHFYLLLPLLLLALMKMAPGARDPFARSLPFAAGALFMALLALRLATAAWQPSFSFLTHFCPTHLRLDSLLFGVLISYVHHFRSPWFAAILSRRRWGLLALGCGCLLPPFFVAREASPFVCTFGFTLNYLGAGAILVGVLSLRLPQNLLVRLLSCVGRSSYSIYLWHMPVIVWGIPLAETVSGYPLGFPLSVALCVCGSVLVGTGMGSLVEWPALRLRDRWFPSRVRPVPTENRPLAFDNREFVVSEGVKVAESPVPV